MTLTYNVNAGDEAAGFCDYDLESSTIITLGLIGPPPSSTSSSYLTSSYTTDGSKREKMQSNRRRKESFSNGRRIQGNYSRL